MKIDLKIEERERGKVFLIKIDNKKKEREK
jgi:hypothetical protein